VRGVVWISTNLSVEQLCCGVCLLQVWGFCTRFCSNSSHF